MKTPATFRILFKIGGTEYGVAPVRNAPPALAKKAYRLFKHGPETAVYDVRQAPAGHVICTCPGHTYRGRCKHVRCLQAAGMLA